MKKHRQKTKIHAHANESTELMSSALQEEFLRFVEYHPPRRLNRNLRKMLLEHLMHEDSLEDLYLQDLLYDLQGLFELFDAVELEESGRELASSSAS